MSQIDPATLEQEILRRLDPKGEMTELIDTFTLLIDSRVGRGMLRLLKAVGLDLAQLHEPMTQARALVADMTAGCRAVHAAGLGAAVSSARGHLPGGANGLPANGLY